MKKYLLILLLASCATKENIEPAEPVKKPIIMVKESTETLARKVIFEDVIYFSYDSILINDKAEKKLAENATWLKQNPAKKLLIQGHCDERGTKEYNLALGERRAYTVKNFLINSGINKQRLSTVSFGEERPKSLGSSERAHAKNRRAQFIIN